MGSPHKIKLWIMEKCKFENTKFAVSFSTYFPKHFLSVQTQLEEIEIRWMCIVMYSSRSASTYFGTVTAVMCEHSWRWESRSFQWIMIDLRKPPWLTHFFVSKDEYVVVDFYEQQPGQKIHNKKAMGKKWVLIKSVTSKTREWMLKRPPILVEDLWLIGLFVPEQLDFKLNLNFQTHWSYEC